MPKSSTDSVRPIWLRRVERRLGARRVGHQHALGDLELEQLGLDVPLGQQARDLDRELRVQERAGGEVDRDRELQAGVLPRAHLADRGVEHERRQRRDQAGLLGDRDELARPDDPELRVIPARERLGAHDPARPQVGLRLVVELDLALADRRAQAAGEREAARRVAVELGLEDRVAAAGLLGRVHRDVGALLQRLVVLAVHRVQREADRGVDLQPHPLEHERLAQVHRAGSGRPAWRPRACRRAGAARRTRRRRGGRPCRSRAARRSSRRETSCSSRSPMWCPSVSLISLKWSRSMIMTTAEFAVAAARADGLVDPVAEQLAVRAGR